MRRAAAIGCAAIVCAALCAGCTSSRGPLAGSATTASPGHTAASVGTSPSRRRPPAHRTPNAASTSASAARSAEPSPGEPAGADDPTVVPAIADNPTTLGRQLVAAARAVLAPGRSGYPMRAAARTAEVAYDRLAQHPGWDATVLALVPASLRASVVATVRAGRELAAIRSPAPKGLLPAWRIVAPAPAAKLLSWYRTAGARFGVGWQYLAAVNLVESTFGKVHGLSVSGAQGPMQFLPETWAAYGAGGDVNDPHDAIFAAARFLADRGFAHDVTGALYGYNPTMHYVRAIKAIASVLVSDPRSFAGYYHWDVYYPTSSGVLLLPVGYSENHRISAAAYARDYPARVLH